MHALVYLALLVSCCTYAAARGGAPERWGVAILLAAVFASLFTRASGTIRYAGIEIGFLVVDFAMLLAVIALMLRAQRYWPIVMAAVLIDTVITHLLMLSPRLMPFSYGLMIAAWSYPNPILLAAGAWRHQGRMAAFGNDPDWS